MASFTWNPNDPKRPCFGELTFKNRGHRGSMCILYPSPAASLLTVDDSHLPPAFPFPVGYGFPNRSLEGTWRIIPFSKWLGSPPFISHKFRPFGRVPQSYWKGTKAITMVMKTIYVSSWDDPPSKTRWWFQFFFHFHPYLGEDSHFDEYFSKGLVKNHQPPKISPKNLRYCTERCRGGPGRQCWCCDGLRKGAGLEKSWPGESTLATGPGSLGPHLKNKDLIRPYYINENNWLISP